MKEKDRSRKDADSLYKLDKMKPKEVNVTVEQSEQKVFEIKKEDLVKGIILSEILGKPKGRRR